MGIFDFLNSSPQPATPPQAAPAPQASPDFNTFIQNLIAARVAQSRANPTNVLSWINGDATKAAQTGATFDAPALWDVFKQAQAGSQGAQLGNTANMAAQGAMADTHIDPNNIAGSQDAIQRSLSGAFNTQGGGASGANPLEAQRAFYNRMGMMYSRMPGGGATAKEYFALRDKGVPDNTTVLGTGRVVDGASGNPISGGVGDVKRSQAEPTKRMETGYQMQAAGNQAGLDRQTHAVNADTDAAHKLNFGIDKTTGLPTTKTDAELLQGGKDSFADKNPFFEGQQSELKELRGKSESADQGLNLGVQIVNAANGVLTGRGANALQDVRKLALTAGKLAGVDVNEKMLDSTSKFEQLKFASQQLVAVASHELSPRVAMNIYNQIAAVKPGDQTSMKGLRDIIVNQLIPVFQRSKAVYGATGDYYRKNPMANDAQAVVPGQHPLEQYGVKDVHSAEPGDFFIDPQSGNLRQRSK